MNIGKIDKKVNENGKGSAGKDEKVLLYYDCEYGSTFLFIFLKYSYLNKKMDNKEENTENYPQPMKNVDSVLTEV